MLKKFLIPIAGLLLLAAVGSYILPQLEKQSVIDANTQDAINTVQLIKALRGYYTNNVVVKAKQAGIQIDFNHNDSSTIPLPATLVHELSQLSSSKDGSRFYLFSQYPFPNRTSRQLDQFQKDAWNSLTKDPKAIIASKEMLNGQLVLRIALADTMQSQGCVDCHNSHPLSPKTDWQLGDVRGVLEVTKSLENVYINARETRINIIVSMLFIIVLVMFTLHILFKKLCYNELKN